MALTCSYMFIHFPQKYVQQSSSHPSSPEDFFKVDSLWTRFTSFDLDKSGSLDYGEFTRFIQRELSAGSTEVPDKVVRKFWRLVVRLKKVSGVFGVFFVGPNLKRWVWLLDAQDWDRSGQIWTHQLRCLGQLSHVESCKNYFTSSDPHRDIILKHICHKFWHSLC